MRAGPWLWGWKVDLGVFVLPTLAALALVGALRAGGHEGRTPEWAWVVLVLGVDVAHVWATGFRSYLDPVELRRRPWLYALVPLGCWLGGVALHAHSAGLFWRVLAYVAVFHFVRQQAGWTAIYRARAGQTGRLDRGLDEAAVYLGAGVPLLLWHTRMPRPFAWFVEGDFVALAGPAWLDGVAHALLLGALGAWGLRQARLGRRGEVAWGKVAVVLSTAVSWYGGIVLATDDLTFTALNVLPHGVPYFALLWAYGRARRRRVPASPGSRIVGAGLGAFVGVLVLAAVVEETLWDRLVWHERGWLFGWLPAVEVSAAAVLVPLLAVPQATHYVLDAFLWRRGAGGPEQAEALGFVAPAGR